MDRTFLLIGSLAGLTGVGLGAFAAHGLRGRLSPDLLEIFETGVRYQMYHALAIVTVAVALGRLDAPALRFAGWGFTAGILVFSGSLYLLTFTGVRTWGAVTPVGGLAFLAGWALLAYAAIALAR